MAGLEFHGMEHLEDETKGALIIYYHGLTIVDQFLFVAEIYLRSGRVVGGVVERAFLKFPLVQGLFKVIYTSHQCRRREHCTNTDDHRQGGLDLSD